MAVNAAQLAIQLKAEGDEAVIGSINRVSGATDKVTDKVGKASRTASNFGASMAQAGTLGATSLAGIAQQASEIVAGFGPEGAVVGALATTTIAIGAMFFKAEQEMEKFRTDVRKLLFDTNFAAAQAQYDDLQFQIKEANDTIVGLKAIESLGGAQGLAARAARLKAEHDMNVLIEKRTYLVPRLQELAVKVGERQAIALHLQQEQTAEATREAAAQEAAAKAIRDKAQAHKDMEAANASLAKASEGITLAGPTVDRGLGSLDNAPVVPVQIQPTFPDTAQAEWIAKLADMAPGIQSAVQQTFGGAIEDGFMAAFSGKNPLKAFGKTILAGLGKIFMDMGVQLIGFGKIMTALQKWLLNPLTAGPAAVAAGIALLALGAALASIAGGSGGGGAGGGSSFGGVGEINAPARVTNITIGASGASKTAAGLTPQQPIHFTVIGPGDPQAQRAIVETLDNARRRGLA